MNDEISKRILVSATFEKPLGPGWNWYRIGVGRPTGKTVFWMCGSGAIRVKSQRFVETWDKDWEMWVSVKFTGPKYGFPSEDGKSHIWFDRLVLVEPEGAVRP